MERFQLQSMQLERRKKIHLIHKEMLVADLLEKKERSQGLLKQKEQSV